MGGRFLMYQAVEHVPSINPRRSGQRQGQEWGGDAWKSGWVGISSWGYHHTTPTMPKWTGLSSCKLAFDVASRPHGEI